MFSWLFKNKKTPFLLHYKRISKEIKAGKLLTPEGNKYSPATARNYTTGSFPFERWEKEKGKIYLEDINLRWVEPFILFLMSKGYTKNTIAGTLTRLKAVLRRLNNDGICTYNGNGIRTSTEEVTTVYTTLDEIRTMLTTDFTNTPGMDRLRDIYVLHCFVGFRFQDLKKFLRKPHSYLREEAGKLFIDVKTKKKGEVVVIPVSRIVKDMLVRYDYNFDKLFSLSFFNREIKTMARKSGITQDVIFSRTEGGIRVDRQRQKCELMSSHTARRTFATNAFLAGVPEKNIMLITGHKSTASFHRYIRCTALDAAIKIVNHDFFNIDLPLPLSLPNKNDGNDLPSPNEAAVSVLL